MPTPRAAPHDGPDIRGLSYEWVFSPWRVGRERDEKGILFRTWEQFRKPKEDKFGVPVGEGEEPRRALRTDRLERKRLFQLLPNSTSPNEYRRFVQGASKIAWEYGKDLEVEVRPTPGEMRARIAPLSKHLRAAMGVVHGLDCADIAALSTAARRALAEAEALQEFDAPRDGDDLRGLALLNDAIVRVERLISWTDAATKEAEASTSATRPQALSKRRAVKGLAALWLELTGTWPTRSSRANGDYGSQREAGCFLDLCLGALGPTHEALTGRDFTISRVVKDTVKAR